MEVMMKTTNISPYADPATVMRRGMPIVSNPCPGCGKQCDFLMVLHGGGVSYDICCPGCGTTRVSPGIEDGEIVYTIDGTGERYDSQAALNAAKDRLRAVEGNAPEECLAMAEVAWETYLNMTARAPAAWEGAVDAFNGCAGIDKDHARRMVPWILRFCGLGASRSLKEVNRSACAKAVCAIGKPETAQDCMLWMEYFHLECRNGMLGEHDTSIPDIAKATYLALTESEQAECPEFPVLWPLIMFSCASDYRDEGGIDCSEDELDIFESEMWNEAVSQAEKMLSAGHPMTSRIVRMFTAKAGHEMLPPSVSPVCDQLRRLGELSGAYGDAFRAEADLLEVLMSVRGSPVMPYSKMNNIHWDSGSLEKLVGAIKMLEEYHDPAVVNDMMIDAYYLLYTHNGSPDTLDYCKQLQAEADRRLIDISTKLYLGVGDDLLSMLGEMFANGAEKKPKAMTKKERVAEKRKAHIAKRR